MGAPPNSMNRASAAALAATVMASPGRSTSSWPGSKVSPATSIVPAMV